MAPIPLARMFNDLPKLSDSFLTLFRELRESAPDELISNQVKAAASLTDTPMTEGLRRLASYADYTPSNSYYLPSNTTNLLSAVEGDDAARKALERLTSRLGRDLTDTEEVTLGSTRPWVLSRVFSDFSPRNIRNKATKDLNLAATTRETGMLSSPGQRAKFLAVARAALEDAREARMEAQRRMADEYFFGDVQ